MAASPTTSLVDSSPLKEFNELVKSIGHCSATHWSLISNYLIKPSSALSKADLDKLPVNPHAGTGKMPHSVTERIMHMRRKVHPIRTVIEKRLLDEKERKAVFLFHLEGLTFEEIETMLAWSSGAARTAIIAGVASLRSQGFKLQNTDIP
jgi:hypothetical protein